jgi:hypothetical protein
MTISAKSISVVARACTVNTIAIKADTSSRVTTGYAILIRGGATAVPAGDGNKGGGTSRKLHGTRIDTVHILLVVGSIDENGALTDGETTGTVWAHSWATDGAAVVGVAALGLCG